MPRYGPNYIPKYRRHAQSGQAVVTLSGFDHMLGPHNSRASREQYDKLVAEWIAGGRMPLRGAGGSSKPAPITISELVRQFLKVTSPQYRTPTGNTICEADHYRCATRQLLALYGSDAADQFGPRKLNVVRDAMVKDGWVRTSINRHINRIRRIFKWAVSQELLPSTTWESLRALEAIRKGRGDVKEGRGRGPALEPLVEKVLSRATSVLATMIRVQLLTGMRPGELVLMRPKDIDRTKDVWFYRPQWHKTQNCGRDRVVPIGPQAQALLLPFLNRDADRYLFSPRESERERREKLTLERTTPLSCGNRVGSNRSASPRKTPGLVYTVRSYSLAVRGILERALPEPSGLKGAVRQVWLQANRWSPNQLRHSAATRIRQEYGVDAAQQLLGHSSVRTTEIYAVPDMTKAATAMRLAG